MEAAVTRFDDHNVAGLWGKRVNDLEIPRSEGQQPATQLGSLAHQAQGELLPRIRGVGSAGC